MTNRRKKSSETRRNHWSVFCRRISFAQHYRRAQMRLGRRPAATANNANNQVRDLSVNVNHDKRGTLTIFRQTAENSRAPDQSVGDFEPQRQTSSDKALKRTLC